MTTTFEVYTDKAGYYRWRLVAANGEIVANSEAYSTRSNAVASAAKVKVWASSAVIV